MDSIQIIYASQTGNSENSAELLCTALSASHGHLKIKSARMDDYIVSTTATSSFPDYLVVITSSYGVGQPPLGGEIYRTVIDR